MKRILCIVGSMNAGGAETFLMKLYRNMDLEKYQMDFCVSIKEPGVYDEEIHSLGGKILYTVPKSNGFIKSFKSIKKIVSENNYQYVMRVSQHSLSGLELIAAKRGGAKVTVFRSSNTQTGGGLLNRILHLIFLPVTMFVPDIKIAPSTEAADFMFGINSVRRKNVLILRNALEIDKYAYNAINRVNYRRKFGLENNFVVGNVGRMSKQKNHDYLINIFSEIKKQKNNAILLLVGTGNLKEKLQEKVESLGLRDSVIFLGVREDIPQLLSTMDIFVFPSLYEGLPNTVIEAQTSGLPCLISNTITKEVKITDLVYFLSIKKKAREWADVAIKLALEKQDRTIVTTLVSEAGYGIGNITRKFEQIIFNGYDN